MEGKSNRKCTLKKDNILGHSGIPTQNAIESALHQSNKTATLVISEKPKHGNKDRHFVAQKPGISWISVKFSQPTKTVRPDFVTVGQRPAARHGCSFKW